MLGLLDTSLNLMAWHYLTIAGIVISSLLHLNRNLWIKRHAWSISQDSTNYTSAEQTQATNLYEGVISDDLQALVTEVSIAVALWIQRENWALAQIMTLPEADRKEYMEESSYFASLFVQI